MALLWGVSVQLIAQGSSRLVGSDLFASAGGERGLASGAAFIGAVIAFALGECVRRGVGWSRRLVVALGVALTALGVVSLPGSVHDLEHGFVWSAVPTAILLTVAPLMALWMHGADSRCWFRLATSEVARRRHGAVWVGTLTLVAVVSGLLVAYAEARHR